MKKDKFINKFGEKSFGKKTFNPKVTKNENDNLFKINMKNSLTFDVDKHLKAVQEAMFSSITKMRNDFIIRLLNSNKYKILDLKDDEIDKNIKEISILCDIMERIDDGNRHKSIQIKENETSYLFLNEKIKILNYKTFEIKDAMLVEEDESIKKDDREYYFVFPSEESNFEKIVSLDVIEKIEEKECHEPLILMFKFLSESVIKHCSEQKYTIAFFEDEQLVYIVKDIDSYNMINY